MEIDDIGYPLLRNWFKAFKEYPNVGNRNFLVGYITALRETGYIDTSEAAEFGNLMYRLENQKNA